MRVLFYRGSPRDANIEEFSNAVKNKLTAFKDKRDSRRLNPLDSESFVSLGCSAIDLLMGESQGGAREGPPPHGSRERSVHTLAPEFLVSMPKPCVISLALLVATRPVST